MATVGFLDYIVRAIFKGGSDIDNASKSFDKLGQHAKAAGKEIDDAFEIAPLDQFQKEIAATAKEAEKSGQSMSEVFGDRVTPEIKKGETAIKNITSAIQQLRRPSIGLGENAGEAFAKESAAIERAKKEIEDYRKSIGQQLEEAQKDLELFEKEQSKAAPYTSKRVQMETATYAKKGDIAILENLQKRAGQTSDIFDDLKKQLEDLAKNNEVKIGDTTKAVQSTESYRTQILKLRQAMADLEEQARATGGEAAVAALRGSAEFQNMQREAGRLSNAMNDANKQMSVFASDTAGLDALRGGLQGVSGAFSAVTGGIGLFTKENENLQKIMLKVQSVMSITMGLKELDNLLNKDSAFQLVIGNKYRQFKNVLMGKETILIDKNTKAIVASNVAAKGGTKAVTGLAGAFKLLGAAIKKVPVFGWIIAAISALTIAISKHNQKLQEQREENAKVYESEVENIAKLKILTEQYKKLGNSVKAKEQFIKNNKKEFDKLGIAITNVSQAEDVFVNNTSSMIKAFKMRAEIAAMETKIAEKYREKFEIEERLKQEREKAEKNDRGYTEEEMDELTHSSQVSPRLLLKQRANESSWGTYNAVKSELEKKEKEIDEIVEKIVTKQEEVDALFEKYQPKEDDGKKEKREIEDMTRKTIDNQIAFYQKYFEERRSQLTKSNVAGFEEIDQAEINILKPLLEEQNRLKKEQLEKQKNDREKIIKENIKSEEKQKSELLKIEKWYESELKVIDQETEVSKSALGTSAQTAKENALNEMVNSAETAQQKIALLNDKITELQNTENRTSAQNKWLEALQKQYKELNEDFAKEQENSFNELLAQYGTYLQQRKKMDEQYAADLEAVNKREQSGELDENAAAVLKGNLKKGYEESLASLTGNYIKGLVSKAFDPKATRAAIQKAMDVMNELDTETQPEDSVLAKYGLAPENWEEVREAVKKTKKELGELIDAKDKQQSKTDIASRLFGSFAEKWSEVKKAFTKDANGEYADAQAGIAGVMEMANMAADSLGKMGEMLGQIGELTGNNNLKEYANGLNGISNVLSGTIQGAQSGGIAGAIVGFAGGMLNTILEDMDNSEAIAREQQAREDASNAIDEFTDSIGSTIDALASFQDSLTSLDYLNFDRAINALLSQMSDQLNDSTKRWEGMVEGATDLIMRDNAIGNMINGFLGMNTLKGWEGGQELMKQTDAAAQLKALGIDLDQLMNVTGGYEATKLIADTINARMKGMKGELEGLMKELESMRDDPTTSALDLFNKMQEIRKKNLELMEYELLVMKAAGKDTTDLENQIRDATLELQKATAEMVGAYAGTDVASVVEDWIKIFDEFGTTGSTAMDKINQSVDKMVANMLKQRIVVKSLEEEIDKIWAGADTNGDESLDPNEIENAIDRTREAAGKARDFYDELQQQLKERGISLDEVSGGGFSQAVKGVSEETASIIAGQMNAIRVHQIETQEILRENIARDVETIARNTQHLVTMDAKMASIDRRLGDLQTTYQTRMS